MCERSTLQLKCPVQRCLGITHMNGTGPGELVKKRLGTLGSFSRVYERQLRSVGSKLGVKSFHLSDCFATKGSAKVPEEYKKQRRFAAQVHQS